MKAIEKAEEAMREAGDKHKAQDRWREKWRWLPENVNEKDKELER